MVHILYASLYTQICISCMCLFVYCKYVCVYACFFYQNRNEARVTAGTRPKSEDALDAAVAAKSAASRMLWPPWLGNAFWGFGL